MCCGSNLSADKSIQLLRESLSDKVHATTPKGIVGGVEFTVFQKNLKEWQEKTMDICLRVLKESNKSRFDNYSVRKSVLNISHITFRAFRVHIFPTVFLEIAVYIQLPRGVATHLRQASVVNSKPSR